MAGRRAPGSGSLYVPKDKPGIWYAKWSVNGTQIKRRIGPQRKPHTRDGMTRKDAETEMRRLMSEVKPTVQPGEGSTIGDVGARYVKRLQLQGRKPATIVAVESVLKIWLVPFFGDKDVRRLRKEDVDDLISMMLTGRRPGPRTTGDRRYGHPVSPKTLHNYVGTLSALLTFAKVPNVVHDVEDMPAIPEFQEIRFLDQIEVRTLAGAAVPGDYQQIDRALYLTAAMSGLREGELIALRWQDVDWEAQRIRVRQNYVLGQFGTPKSRRSTRSVPMAREVWRQLDALSKAAGDPHGDMLVFADPFTGGPLDKAAILRRYRRALKAAMLPPRRFHDLRHTFGTHCAAQGVPMTTLKEWMGHRDIKTTERYADYAPSAREAAMIDAAFTVDLPGTSPGTSTRAETVTQENPRAANTG
jgi:integrase